MSFTPCNRYLLVDRLESEEDVAISSEVRPPLAAGKHVVVLSHMIEEVDFGEGSIYLVLENHVLGVVG